MATTRKVRREPEYVKIPDWVADLESFRVWSDSVDFPEVGRITYFDGGVFVDMSKQQLYSHGLIKTEIAAVLTQLSKSSGLGSYWCNGAYLTNTEADLSTVPDGLFISHQRIKDGRIRPVEGKLAGFVEFEGTPDMVLEIVSDRSVTKDKVRMRELYWLAGIPEYWLVDARGSEIEFDVLRINGKGYVATRKYGGWIKSNTFGRSFRLVSRLGAAGLPEYDLEMR